VSVAHLLILGILTAVPRVIPRLILPYAISSDAFYHLLAADRIRANGFRLPERLRGLFFPGPYDYPPLFHVLLALFPRRVILLVERFVSAAVDVAYVWLFYGFTARVLVSAYGLDTAAASERALVVAVLVSISPALLYMGRGPRSHNANPRIVSEFLFSAVMVFTWGWMATGAWWHFAAAAAVAAVLMLTSKFGAQVIVFFFPLLAVLLASPSLLLVPLAGFGLALIPFCGHYVRVLKGHVGHLALFAQVGGRRRTTMSYKSEWAACLRLLLKPARPGSWYRLFCINSISCFLVRNPQLLILPPVVGWTIRGNGATVFMTAWITVSVVVFLVITLRRLLFLGEPERYVSYSVVAQFVLVAAFWDRIPSWLLIALAAYSVVVSAGYQVMFVKLNYKPAESRSRGAEVQRFFRTQSRVRWILPISEGPYNLAYTSEQEVFYPCGNFQVWHTPVSEYLRIYEDFLRPRRETLLETVARYGIDTILVNRRNDIKQFWRYVEDQPVLFENETFIVYDVSAVGAGDGAALTVTADRAES
jgi:hypothetical protein